ncbi:hypothetical protein RRF57_006210 [Xylaria bambusicola]|uniref:Rhodopsin domain-containing protein n=1 Tax=Xylaria bambusicola TaxID=326684 RepID=A0AAN7UDX7_9PEZI
MSAPPGTLIGSFGHNTGGQIDVALETFLLALDYVSLGFRLWSRSMTKTRLQINDWLIILATVCLQLLITMSAGLITSMIVDFDHQILMTARYSVEVAAILKCGVGLHIEEVVTVGGPDILTTFTQLLYAVDLLFVTVITLLKLSILHFYSVLFPERSFRRLVYVAMSFCIVFWFGSFFGTVFLCDPPQKKWFSNLPGHCKDAITMYVSIVAGDLITDLIIIALPMPTLWRLHLAMSVKVPILLAFGLGFAIAAITSIRIKYFIHLDTADPLYSIWPDAVLSALVPLLGILNANLLVSRPALKTIFHNSSFLKSPANTEDRSHHFKVLTDNSIPLSNVTGELNNKLSAFDCF